MLPSPALLRSWPKETTLKASIVYSGRQHANEVSSTSHIHKLAEQLVTDPSKRALLNKVNVVIHPITNPMARNFPSTWLRSHPITCCIPDIMAHLVRMSPPVRARPILYIRNRAPAGN